MVLAPRCRTAFDQDLCDQLDQLLRQQSGEFSFLKDLKSRRPLRSGPTVVCNQNTELFNRLVPAETAVCPLVMSESPGRPRQTPVFWSLLCPVALAGPLPPGPQAPDSAASPDLSVPASPEPPESPGCGGFAESPALEGGLCVPASRQGRDIPRSCQLTHHTPPWCALWGSCWTVGLLPLLAPRPWSKC